MPELPATKAAVRGHITRVDSDHEKVWLDCTDAAIRDLEKKTATHYYCQAILLITAVVAATTLYIYFQS